MFVDSSKSKYWKLQVLTKTPCHIEYDLTVTMKNYITFVSVIHYLPMKYIIVILIINSSPYSRNKRNTKQKNLRFFQPIKLLTISDLAVFAPSSIGNRCFGPRRWCRLEVHHWKRALRSLSCVNLSMQPTLIGHQHRCVLLQRCHIKYFWCQVVV